MSHFPPLLPIDLALLVLIKVARVQRIDYFAEANTKSLQLTMIVSKLGRPKVDLRTQRRGGGCMRVTLYFCFLGALILTGATLRSASEDKWWPDYAGGPASARYFDSSQINRSNVDKLEVAWTYPFGETGSNPIVVGGTIYGRGRGGALIALDARTGKEIWIREGMQGMTARGINYWQSNDG